ncbi:TonB-dependent receptor domain-containing protein [Sphingomonas sp. S6]|jgi:iron complex outermembrane receptor protein|uniref:TonB-dependent receptor domain-containing protein n=1 Tax=Sphingomonas sp. S6 TaxID=3368600 RepID=UPI000FB84368|nr:TonB-dependent receptor [uncultured Sphingomonas sp.]RTL21050.1 MAG: TonB-dependent receptor [Sphingomonadaceae bacterium]
MTHGATENGAVAKGIYVTKTARFDVTRKAALLAAATPLALMLGAAPAFAQTATQTPAQLEIKDQQTDPTTTQGASDQDKASDIVVTGSLFRRTDTETPSPVTVLTSDTLAKAGITTASDAIRSISADSAGSIGTGFQSGFSAGGSAVSLRGLGVSSTLVLIDGLRSANFPLNDDGHNAYVDLNSIPFSLVDRIEVLKDGASSTYGADAIGGVVNVILKKHFTGIDGLVEGGVAERGDASHQRAQLTLGYGDYDRQGFNVYLNGEYQRDGRVSNHSRGFPYNTQDLTSIGGLDNNAADQSLTVNVPTAYVARTTQSDLNNPLSGGTALIPDGTYVDANGRTQNYSNYTALGLGNCARDTFTVTGGGARGTGCKYDLVDLYRQIQPLQERYSLQGRVSVRIGENVEGYITGSYSRSDVSINGTPSAIRATQPFGAAPTVASSNPGIVLPYFICSAGTNCATAANRQLNPNNPYATNAAATPAIAAANAARIYYLFGDIPQGSDRKNEIYRATAGLNGNFGDGRYNWRIEGVYARDELTLTQRGLLNIAGLATAINTGSYNFINPSQNSAAVRNAISPNKVTPSLSTQAALDASVTARLADLPGGPLQLAVGGQVRRETLENNNQNAALDTYGLTTASAFGSHTVSAAYFEADAPILDQVELNVSGRYDHYSEGFSHFSPKVGVKFTPIKELAIRGTYAEGFRAPTFAESGPRSQYAGFVSTTPPCNFILNHGGTGTAASCSAAGNPYNLNYSLGRGLAGNPNLQPEISRSFTGGVIFQPVRWLSLTVDYYNVRKKNLIVTGPDFGKAVAAYYNSANAAAGAAAVAAVGQGYSVNTTDAVDPLFPNALPRVLIINVPYVNANYALTSGIDFSATATVPLGDGIKFTSRIEATHVIKYNLVTSAGVQHYAGTMGPYDLSSGNGTPSWRGNWQNTLDFGDYSLSATAFYVSRIKAVSEDQGLPLDCANGNLYTRSSPQNEAFCYVSPFINVDLNGTVKVNDKFTFFLNVKNVFDAKAPVAPAAYSSAPNFLTTWHYAGLIGRQYRAGASFRF